ncbi:hypothetical protein GGI12_001703 [Dipsacomyces acuminosporus]|nr:hypothetical protein GGI12_001703 [Dipsacomyces acuminosporus]
MAAAAIYLKNRANITIAINIRKNRKISSVAPNPSQQLMEQQQQQQQQQPADKAVKAPPKGSSSSRRSASSQAGSHTSSSSSDTRTKSKDLSMAPSSSPSSPSAAGTNNGNRKTTSNNAARPKDSHSSHRKQSQSDHKKSDNGGGGNGNVRGNSTGSTGSHGSANGSTASRPAQSRQRKNHSQNDQKQQQQQQASSSKRQPKNKLARRSSNTAVAATSDGSVPGRRDQSKRHSKHGSASNSDHDETGEGSSSMDFPGDDSDDSDDEYAIGFSQEEWDSEVRGRTVLPSGLEQSLTAQILHTYETRLFPSAESIEIKRAFIEKFATILTIEFPEWEVDIHVFGSSVNGLGTSRSDVDICLTTEHKELENVFVLSKALRKYSMRTYCVPHARVPIVKAWDPELRTASDINVNNTIALHNTRMIQTFVAIDARVRPFVMAIKHWTKSREINDAAFGGTLSPYAWVNLAINFLQTRNPPILPVLHPPRSPMPSDDTRATGEVDLSFNDDIESLRGFGLANTESIGFLLYAFFRTYAYEFDYRHQVVSLRNGCYLTKEQKGWDKGRPSRIFCIEEPFSIWLNLGHSANTTSVEGIRQEFQRAFHILRDGGSYDEVCEVYQRPQRTPAQHSSGALQNTAGDSQHAGSTASASGEKPRHYSSNSSASQHRLPAASHPHQRSSSSKAQSKGHSMQKQVHNKYGVMANGSSNNSNSNSNSTVHVPIGQTKSYAGIASAGFPASNRSISADSVQISNSYTVGYNQSPYGIYHNTSAISSPMQIPYNLQRRDSDDIIALGVLARQQQQQQQQQKQILSQYLYLTQNQILAQQQHQNMILNALHKYQSSAGYPIHNPQQQQQHIEDVGNRLSHMAIGGTSAESVSSNPQHGSGGNADHRRTLSEDQINRQRTSTGTKRA